MTGERPYRSELPADIHPCIRWNNPMPIQDRDIKAMIQASHQPKRWAVVRDSNAGFHSGDEEEPLGDGVLIWQSPTPPRDCERFLQPFDRIYYRMPHDPADAADNPAIGWVLVGIMPHPSEQAG